MFVTIVSYHDFWRLNEQNGLGFYYTTRAKIFYGKKLEGLKYVFEIVNTKIKM